MKPKLIIEIREFGFFTIGLLDSAKHFVEDLEFLPMMSRLRMRRINGSTTATLGVIHRHWGEQTATEMEKKLIWITEKNRRCRNSKYSRRRSGEEKITGHDNRWLWRERVKEAKKRHRMTDECWLWERERARASVSVEGGCVCVARCSTERVVRRMPKTPKLPSRPMESGSTSYARRSSTFGLFL